MSSSQPSSLKASNKKKKNAGALNPTSPATNTQENEQPDFSGKLWTPEDFKIAYAAISGYK